MSLIIDRRLSGYWNAWDLQPRGIVLEEYSSALLESNEIPDPFTFVFNDEGQWVLESTGVVVENAMAKNTKLELLELDGFRDIQSWAWPNRTGVAFLLSPHDFLNGYPRTKITVYESEGPGRFFNRSMLFDYSQNACIDLIKDIGVEFGQDISTFLSVDDVRSHAVKVSSDEPIDWLPIVKRLINIPRQWQMIENGEDLHWKDIALHSANVMYNQRYGIRDIQNRVDNTPVEVITMGAGALSCPSASSSFSRETLNGKLIVNCGACGELLNKIMFKGDKCPHCKGTYEGC